MGRRTGRGAPSAMVEWNVQSRFPNPDSLIYSETRE
jgi:hypothetical protein